MQSSAIMKSSTRGRTFGAGALATLAIVSGLALGGSPRFAVAEEINCPPNVIRRTVDNVFVNGPCTIRLSTLKGNIVVAGNGDLTVIGSTIRGSIQSEGAQRIRLLPDPTTGRETRVIGDIQIKNSLPGSTSVIQDVTVGGSIQLVSNNGPINVFGNTVGQDVQVFENLALVRVRDNTIDGNLQCKQNRPRPRNGGGNTVGGNAEDQCVGFDQ